MASFTAVELEEWSGGVWMNGQPEAITGVSKDTRTLRPGDV